MLYLIVTIIVMLGFLNNAVRQGRLSRLKLQTRFKLFGLRDELRWAVIKGGASPNKWFEYLDTTITKAIDHLDDINLPESLALVAVYSRNEDVQAAIAKRKVALSNPANHNLAVIGDRFIACLTEFLVKRHFGTVWSGTFLLKIADRINMVNRGLVKIFASAPETSTLMKYAR